MDKSQYLEQFNLRGRTAIVTGGSRGLGAAIVNGFAEAGADVIVVSRKMEACAELARSVSARTGRRVLPYAANVGHWAELDGLVHYVYSEFPAVDILVNNAGMSPLYGRIVDISEELYDKVLAVNLKGPFRLSALVGTRMAAAGGGSVINISSTSAVKPTPDVVPYALAKAGMNAMTIALSKAFGPKVRVNAIQPGPFLSDISKSWNLQERTVAWKSDWALGRAADPTEIVGSALYFASDASSYTTGAILAVDGGPP